jgi:hypothetical protein
MSSIFLILGISFAKLAHKAHKYTFDHVSFIYAMINVFFKCVSNQVIGILKGNWSLRQRQRLPLHSITHPSPTLQASLHLWYNLHSYVLFAKGEKVVITGLYFIPSIRFWRFMPKGEKVLAQSKRTAPPPNFKINDFKLVNFKFVFPCVLKGDFQN